MDFPIFTCKGIEILTSNHGFIKTVADEYIIMKEDNKLIPTVDITKISIRTNMYEDGNFQINLEYMTVDDIDIDIKDTNIEDEESEYENIHSHKVTYNTYVYCEKLIILFKCNTKELQQLFNLKEDDKYPYVKDHFINQVLTKEALTNLYSVSSNNDYLYTYSSIRNLYNTHIKVTEKQGKLEKLSACNRYHKDKLLRKEISDLKEEVNNLKSMINKLLTHYENNVSYTDTN